MANLVEKYFSEPDLQAITKAVELAESKTCGELAIKIAPRSRHWLDEQIAFAAIVSVIAMLISLYITRDNSWGGFYYNTTSAAVWGAVGFLAAFFVWKPIWFKRPRRQRVVWNRALKLFSQLKPTRGHTGVLIFVSLYESEAAIVADKGIAEKLDKNYWDRPHALIIEGIRNAKHAEGLIAAVEEIGNRLAAHFPHQADDIDELPDRPEILDK
jgi:putative membrane protein